MASDSVLISALQKYIRRCDIDGAITMAYHLCTPYSFQRWHRLWRRLNIIAVEDIGLAHCGVLRYLRSKYSYIEEMEMKKAIDEQFIIDITLRAVATLVSSQKSRLTDHSFIWLKNQFAAGQWTLDDGETIWDVVSNEVVPEDKLLKHIIWNYTHRNGMGRIKDCWDAISYASAAKNPVLIEEIDDARKQWENDDCILFIMYAGLLLARGVIGKPLIEREQISSPVEDNDNITIPDFAYDMHTTEGRSMGRGFEHFIQVSCVLENEPKGKEFDDPYYHELSIKFYDTL